MYGVHTWSNRNNDIKLKGNNQRVYTRPNENQVPSGSTCFAICSASEVARSVLAGVTARMRHVSFVMNWKSMSLICCSMSWG